VRNLFPFFVFILLSVSALAQDDDYYKEEEQRAPVSELDLQELNRWGPKFGIEAHGCIGYSHFYVPSTIAANFSRSVGALAFDAGIGFRIRIFHKLAIATGFNLSGRGYNTEYSAQAEADTGNGSIILDMVVAESARRTFAGFYIKPIIELSRKFHLAVLFHQSWEIRYMGESRRTVTSGPPAYIGLVEVLENESSLPSQKSQFEIGLEFAYKWVIAPQFIIKPHIGINLATSAIFHTGAEMPTPFGGWEQNPSFMTLRLGVIFEMGIWMDQPKTAGAY
jgi:hypothetical protein